MANVLFVDAPVGTGFSYADSFEASKTSDTLSATQTLEFLRKVGKLFTSKSSFRIIC